MSVVMSPSTSGTFGETGNFHDLVAAAASAAEAAVGLKLFNSEMYKSETKFLLAGTAEKYLMVDLVKV